MTGQIWIRQLGTLGGDYSTAVAPDGSGRVYVVGGTSGSLGGPNAGLEDAWLARYDSAGNQNWIRQLGTTSSDSIWGVTPDGSGGVYVSGSTGGNLGGANAGGGDAWFARYDNVGNQIWVRQLGSNLNEMSNCAAPDGSGGVYLSGQTVLPGGQAFNDAWLARYDSTGNQTWIRQIGTPVTDVAFAATPDG